MKVFGIVPDGRHLVDGLLGEGQRPQSAGTVRGQCREGKSGRFAWRRRVAVIWSSDGRQRLPLKNYD